MKGKTGQASTILRPLLDSHLDSAVAIVGCSASGIDRYSCEFDVLIVTEDRAPSASLKFGDVYVDATFITDEDVLKPDTPEHALALAGAKPVRDTSLILSTGSATTSAMLSESAEKASRGKLASALKTLGRAEAALAKEELIDADFWLLSASYDFAHALLFTKETLPSPSHLLSQLRENAGGVVRGFEAVSAGAGLEAAARAGCGARLEGVGVLHDLLREGKPETLGAEWSKVRTEVMAAKANELVTRIELAECYSFLGQEAVEGVAALQRLNPGKTLAALTTGEERLLGERLVRQLGLARERGAVSSGLELLKKQVAALAKE